MHRVSQLQIDFSYFVYSPKVPLWEIHSMRENDETVDVWTYVGMKVVMMLLFFDACEAVAPVACPASITHTSVSDQTYLRNAFLLFFFTFELEAIDLYFFFMLSLWMLWMFVVFCSSFCVSCKMTKCQSNSFQGLKKTQWHEFTTCILQTLSCTHGPHWQFFPYIFELLDCSF